MPVETTLYSISKAPPPVESRRSSERHLTIFRVGSIFIDGARELCLVKNISAGERSFELTVRSRSGRI